MTWQAQRTAPRADAPGMATIAKLLCLVLLAVGVVPMASAGGGDLARAANRTEANRVQPLAGEGAPAPPDAEHWPANAAFDEAVASNDVRGLAVWVAKTTDNNKMPFVIIDKIAAKVFVFDAAGNLRGAAPALLGMARGDDAAAELRNLKMAEIRPEQRVTPAGRFLASIGHDQAGKEILWVDYDNSIALHAVVTNKPEERRLQRLASPDPLDHRISWGCINVPKTFYERIVSPAFKGTQGFVYVLPETRAASAVFGF